MATKRALETQAEQQRKKAVDFLSNERSQSIPMFSGDGVNLPTVDHRRQHESKL